MKVTKLFNEFFESEKTGGLILIFCTLFSLILANSPLGASYTSFWQTNLFGTSIENWINDGLMSIFFLLVGLELEREIYKGELSDIKAAILPIVAAIGGMLIPAIIFILFNYGLATQAGSGIPMATDIAFAIGVLSLLGNRIPTALKVFLTALAVIDDLGAIIVIALFYSTTLNFFYLFSAFGVFAVLLILNRIKVFTLFPYLLGGILMWHLMHHSGIHATITGVLLAFAIPFADGHKNSPSYILQHKLHNFVAFVILPIFALANTGVILSGNFIEALFNPNSYGIIAGLVVGKPLGVFLFSLLFIKLGLCKLPNELSLKSILGAGMLAGIGFTMSIFITLLAFSNDLTLINASKISILIASLASGIIGYCFLNRSLNSSQGS